MEYKLLFLSLLLFTASLLTAQNEKKVLLIGMDGCRPDALAQANTPNLDLLISNGIFSPHAMNGDITISGPGWSAILCGVWSDKHGVTNNTFIGSNYDDYPSILQYIEANDPTLNTASICHWGPINDFIIQNDADFKLTVSTDAAVSTEAVDFISNNDADFIFLHYDEIDYAGHSQGFSPTVPGYISAIEEVDQNIGPVINAIEQRLNYANEDWLILVTTDHGGFGFSHGGTSIEEETVFVIASGKNIDPQIILRDSTMIYDAPINCLADSVELTFYGNNDYVQIPANPNLNFGSNQDFTIECRVKTDQAADVAIVGNKDWDSGSLAGFVFSFKFSNGPEWKVNIGDGSSRTDINTGGAIADNEWHTLSVSFDRDGQMTMYEDGNYVDAADISFIGDIDTNAGLFIGADINGDYEFDGSVAEVRVWNEVIDAATISDWHCSKIDNSHPNYSNLTGYWQLNDGGNSGTVDDLIGGNDGIINNAIWDSSDSTLVYDYAHTPRLTDPAITALTHLCIPYDTAWDLEGTSLVGTCESIIEVQVNVLLEGPHNFFGEMQNSLNSLLPLQSPYSDPPYNAMPVTAASIPSNAVDWILLEMRTGTANTTPPQGTSLLEAQSAFVLEDGSIVGLDGVNPLRFSLPDDGSYYIGIRHRNHLDVMSASSLIPINDVISYDFTNATNNAFGISQQKLSGGFAVMIAGDMNQDMSIQTTDYDAWKLNPAVLDAYDPSDCNLDGIIQVTDYDKWFNNRAKLGTHEMAY